MVKAVTSFGRSGLSDWLVQRVSGVILLVFALVMVCKLGFGGELTYEGWKAFFDSIAIQVLTTAALLSLVAHGWIGMWSISTDYFTERLMGPKGTVIRLAFQALCAVVLFTYLVWGLRILWS
ncbi:succinate dehydrogenase, hydrophobic membrane anchor protein [Litorivivens sp.]|uniref:succinate dehydrogenase, hydrophobic membrane anchor protein n=1 Tax=Litorivivens sp. TaxID=2020868 RepID=UPI0035614326